MILTTTDAVEGRPVKKHLGLVGGEVFYRAKFAWGEAKIKAEFESTLARARRQALERLTAHAADLGADAVVGLSFDWEVQNMALIAHAVGTAVKLA